MSLFVPDGIARASLRAGYNVYVVTGNFSGGTLADTDGLDVLSTRRFDTDVIVDLRT